MSSDENQKWIKSQFKELNLGDKRLNKRTEILASNMMLHPSQSIPEQNKTWGKTKGAYRFFDSKTINFGKIIAPHINQTKALAEKSDLILAIQDTCYISYSHHLSVKGLSDIGGKIKSKGIILHNTLAVDPTTPHPKVLGIIDQDIHRREEFKKANLSREKDQLKETILWQEASQRIKLNRPKVVEVMDREGDVFGIMNNCLFLKHDFVIRAKSNRKLNIPEDKKLFDFVKTLKLKGEIKLNIKKKKGQVPREALLSVKFSKIKIPPAKKQKGEAISCNVVYVIEENPPKEQEPLEWVLLTSVKVNSFEEVCKIIEWYKCRWIIEEYHKCIKSGCKVEEKQFKEEFRIENFLGIANVVAVRLLQLRDLMRIMPEISARKFVDPFKIEILLRYLKKEKKEITIYEYGRLVAGIGGFLGRKSDGEPGWQTLWRGELMLMMLVEGAKLALGL